MDRSMHIKRKYFFIQNNKNSAKTKAINNCGFCVEVTNYTSAFYNNKMLYEL